MKRWTSLLLTAALVLSMVPSGFAAGGDTTADTPPDKIDDATVWRYLDDNSDPAGDPAAEGYDRTSWTAADFDDSQWETASGTFGGKKTDEGITSNGATIQLDGIGGADGNSDNYPTYYFRTTVNIPDASAVTKVVGSIKYDDAAILYINGVRAAGFNDDGCDSNSSYCSHKADTTSDIEITDVAALNLQNGVNTIAVEVHNESANSSDIWFSMPGGLTFSTEALPTETTLIDQETIWSYLDDNSDPAGTPGSEGYDRTSWTVPDFNATAWKTGQGAFGSKRGSLHDGATTNLAGCPGDDTNYPTYYFRTTVTLTADQLTEMTKLVGRIQYDDAAIVYLNGVRAAAFNDAGCDTNASYSTNVAGGNPMEQDFEIVEPAALAALHEGANTVAVELHNRFGGSSDIFFGLPELALSDEAVDYQSNISLSMGADESQMGFTWYSMLDGDASLALATNDAMTDAQTYPVTPATANDGQQSCQVTVTGLQPGTTYYYQLTNAGQKSDVYSFTTDDGGAFSFAYVGDPQIGAGSTQSDILGWDKTLGLIRSNSDFSDVAFLLSAGDQVNGASDEGQYDGYLDHDVLTGLPAATVVGNHDSGSNAYGQHFNIANESDTLGTTAAGGDSWFVYNKVLFLVLNSNDMSVAEHKAFMEQAIAATADQDIQWKVVTFHHSLFTVASHAKDDYITNPTGFKTQIVPVLKDLDIDVVLQGHDHVYCRTYMMDGLNPIRTSDKYEYANGRDKAPTAVNDPDGILYITANSGSGSKMYNIISSDFPFSAVQNQEHVANVSKVSVSDKQFTVTTYRTTDMSVVDSFTIKRDGGDEGTYAPVPTTDTRVTGYYDATGSLKLTLAGRYDSDAMGADGGSLEIVQYNAKNGFAYAVSGLKGKLIAADLNGKLDGDKVVALKGAEYDVKSMVSSYGDMTSVAISPDGTRLAVAIQAANYDDKGSVALFACQADGSLKPLSTVKVGVQPDMLTFADSSTILTADEAEPRQGTNGVDPKGSVTIVTIDPDTAKMTAKPVYFDAFDAQRDALTAAGVLIQKGYQPSTDLEPEYIAVSGRTAYVALQEANAIAVLDLDKAQFTGVYPLGLQDYSKTKLDLQKNDKIELKNYENVYGIKMPDGIAVTTIGGKTYLLTANEGDSRADWAGMDNEYEKKTSPTGNVKLDEKVVWFNATMWDGLDQSKAYVFGGRSFSLYEVSADGLTLVYDSGSDFETITAEKIPDHFNCSNDKISLDNRSGKKGPEPEGIDVGVVNGKTYAFIGLERIGGVMVYDISDPSNATFVNYINSRDFSDKIVNDVSPEGLCFVSAADSKTGSPLLLAACEVSGTMAAYELTPASGSNGGSHSGGGSSSGGGSGSVTYPVTVPTTDGGTVTVSPKSAARGETVTITVKPDAGRTLDQIAATDRNGNALTLTDKGNGVYTFTQPDGAVTLTVRFTAEGTRFADVPADAWYADAVAWAVGQGVTDGVAADRFAPDGACTRAQIVTFLWRAAGSPAPKAASSFTDVPADAWYADAVAWAVEQGITKGLTDTTFGPDVTCTRAQGVTFLWRLEKAPASDAASNAFSDVADGAWYADAVAWAVAHGVTDGTSRTTFSPDGTCTRAQIVTFLWRALAA